MHGAGVKHLAADALSRLKTRGKDKTILDDEVQVLTLPPEIFAYVPRTDTTDRKVIEELKGSFATFIPVVCMMVGITDSKKAGILTIAKSISAPATDADCLSAFASGGKPSTLFNVDSTGKSIQVFRFMAPQSESSLPPFAPFPSLFQLLPSGRPPC